MIHDRYERINALSRAFGVIRQSADGLNVAVHCPNCHRSPTSDRTQKLKLAIRLDTGIYHCWICGIRGRSIANLIRRIGVDNSNAVKLWPVTEQVRQLVQHEVTSNIELPYGFKLLAANYDDVRFRRVREYLQSRGLSISDMWRWRIGVSVDDQFNDRVIVPSFDSNGRLNYYTSRAVDDCTFPRYINASCEKNDICFNELDIDWNDELLLTEGVFDVFSTDDNAVPLLGNSLDDQSRLFNMITSHDTPIVIALDADAHHYTQRIAKLLYSYNIDVKILDVVGYKDIGVMPRSVVSDRRRTARRWTPNVALLDRITRIDVTRSRRVMQQHASI